MKLKQCLVQTNVEVERESAHEIGTNIGCPDCSTGFGPQRLYIPKKLYEAPGACQLDDVRSLHKVNSEHGNSGIYII